MNKIIIGADFVPTESNIENFESSDLDDLFGKQLVDLLKADSFNIFNLEVPLVDEESPINKCGPNLIAPTSTIQAYKTIGVDLLTLANNHIMDQGEQGLVSTIELLNRVEINYVGAGKDISQASKPYIFEFKNKKIGIYACAEHEFSIASECFPGANPFDVLNSFDHINELKMLCDYVIVLYHGGKEHYRYPSPFLQRVCRKMIDKGADLIICQHSHCIGCKEEYNNGLIVYGQGNFLFDYNDSIFWETSLLIVLDEYLNVSYIPLIKKDNGVRIASDLQEKDIMTGFIQRSLEIKNQSVVEEYYKGFAKKNIYDYLMTFGARTSFLVRAINKISKGNFNKLIVKRKYKKGHMIAIRNFVECEAHRELLLQGLKDRAEDE